MGERVWLTKDAYLQLKGQDVPHYIEASPNRPRLVELPDGVVPNKHMKPEFKDEERLDGKGEGGKDVDERDGDGKPALPKTGFNKKQSSTTRPAAAQAEKKDQTKRAADQ
jgi:hypothetical protein